MKKCERIFQFCHQTITALAQEAPGVALRLFLQGALTADQVDNETITYEFISQVGVAWLCNIKTLNSFIDRKSVLYREVVLVKAL